MPDRDPLKEVVEFPLDLIEPFVCPPSIILLGDLIIPGRRALGSLFFINLHHYTGITFAFQERNQTFLQE